MKKHQSGYSLTEIMVVLAIIGVLAAIAGPMVVDLIKKAKTAAHQH